MKPVNDNVPAGEVSEDAKRKPCPICGKPSVVDRRPFCSRRCADVDLHRWLGGRYAIPEEPNDDEDGPEDLDA